MANHKHTLNFEAVVSKLQDLHVQALDEIRAPETHEAALHLKRQIEDAIRCLEFCQQWQILPQSQVTVLPHTQINTPSSNYRIIEDTETDDRVCWLELESENGPLYLYPGDLIIQS